MNVYAGPVKDVGPVPELTIAEMVARVFELADLKPSSRKTYQHALTNFVSWATGRHLDRAILVLYKNHLRERRDLAPRTANLYLAAARTVFRRLFAFGILPFDASDAVTAFDVGNAHKHPPITDAQVARAFAWAQRAKDCRLLLTLNLLYRQGLRQKEIVDLRVEHFKEQEATLAILGKGRDDRELINLHPETTRSLRAYLHERGIKSGYLFASPKRPNTHIGTNALYKQLMTLHAHCRISNSPHGWRKVFTSKLIESGMNLLDVQAYTRHRSVGQLRVYFDRISFQRSLPSYYEVFSSRDDH